MSKYRNKKTGKFAGIFKALSNPHRLDIFLRLIKCCPPGTVCCASKDQPPTCVGDLGQKMNIAPSTISHHLKELRRAGLIRMERQGQKMACWVDPEVVEEMTNFFSQETRNDEPTF